MLLHVQYIHVYNTGVCVYYSTIECVEYLHMLDRFYKHEYNQKSKSVAKLQSSKQ